MRELFRRRTPLTRPALRLDTPTLLNHTDNYEVDFYESRDAVVRRSQTFTVTSKIHAILDYSCFHHFEMTNDDLSCFIRRKQDEPCADVPFTSADISRWKGEQVPGAFRDPVARTSFTCEPNNTYERRVELVYHSVLWDE